MPRCPMALMQAGDSYHSIFLLLLRQIITKFFENQIFLFVVFPLFFRRSFFQSVFSHKIIFCPLAMKIVEVRNINRAVQ